MGMQMFSSDLSQESSQFLILDTSEGELTQSLGLKNPPAHLVLLSEPHSNRKEF